MTPSRKSWAQSERTLNASLPEFDGITIALSKGRILKDTLPLLAQAGIVPQDDINDSRKLIFATNRADVRLLAVRPSDAPTYVEFGAADFGVAGKDVLLESACQNIYELVDLGIARCRMMVAVREDAPPLPAQHIRVASKYVRSARAHFAAQGRQVSVIKLYGSMELAPLVGLADCIVDLVDTGNTLVANGLVAIEEVRQISSRLIVNKAAYKLKAEALLPVIHAMETASQQSF
ncbi:MAG: ATP phosphoribosyltransferase [Cardiobacteriaceae bacterium]|nr:ATP phosphoribosyltransferase [Cardiobacteriaceae bacterium]